MSPEQEPISKEESSGEKAEKAFDLEKFDALVCDYKKQCKRVRHSIGGYPKEWKKVDAEKTEMYNQLLEMAALALIESKGSLDVLRNIQDCITKTYRYGETYDNIKFTEFYQDLILKIASRQNT